MQRKKQDIIVGVVFTIEKAGRRMRWKVIEHPYFDNQPPHTRDFSRELVA